MEFQKINELSIQKKVNIFMQTTPQSFSDIEKDICF